MDPNLIGIALLGFGGGLLGLLGIFRSSWLKNRAFLSAPVVLAVAGGVCALTSESPTLAWAPFSLAAFWLLVTGGERLMVAANVVFSVLRRGFNVLRRPAVACGSLLFISPALAVLWSYAATSEPEYWVAPSDFQGDHLTSIEKVAVAQDVVRTDAGRLLRVKAPVRAASAEEIAAANARPTPDSICTDSAGVDYNCHGWVFTGGRYWIGGAQVETILDDNGYFPVDCPEAGDIVVYRSHGDDILHTGLVRVADEWGILIESKWGAGGRFVHTPENQGYSLEYTYYRSARNGHLLAGIDSMTASQFVSTPTASGAVR